MFQKTPKREYEAPQTRIIKVCVECGFQLSEEDSGSTLEGFLDCEGDFEFTDPDAVSF